MGLLKFHVVFSVLCLLSYIGVSVVFKDRISRFKTKKGKKKYSYWMTFFCPGINVMLVIGFWFMALCDDLTVDLIISKSDEKKEAE